MNKAAYRLGVEKGLPIGLGYLSVSFAYGMMAVNGGVGILTTLLISMTNLTSAGQFAGTRLLAAGGGLVEIALTTLVINLRYCIMSLTLSQKLACPISPWKRAVMAFGITDEIFVLSMLEDKDITFPFFLGLMLLPYAGWSLGTLLGATLATWMPAMVRECLNIALYAMFVALVVPPVHKLKQSKKALLVVLVAAVLSIGCHGLSISTGFSVILVSLAAAALGGWLFPLESQEARP